MNHSSAGANSPDITGLVNFPLWPGHTDSPPWLYSLLLRVSIYRRIHNLMNDDKDEPVGLLWELYWKRADLLEDMLFKLTVPVICDPNTTTIAQLRSKPPPNLQPTVDLLFPQEIANGRHCFKLAYDEPYLAQISSDLGPADNDSEPFSSRLAGWNQLCEGLEERFDRTVREARQIMKAFLEAKLECSEDETKDYILRDYSGETNLIDEMELMKEKNASCSSVLLFAVSGSGKTRRIKHLLSQNYGFYFQACNLPVDVALYGLHGPRKIDGAGDTVLLAKIMDYSRGIIDRYPDMSSALVLYSHIFPPLIICWITNLIHCRIILLQQFIDVAFKGTKFPYLRHFVHLFPQLWLDFQTTSFTGEFNLPDPFESLFQVSCLLPTMNERLKNAKNRLSHLDSPLLYCLDEAQSDLDCRIPTAGGYGGMNLSLFHIWIDCLSNMRQQHSGPQFIFAGTSLQVKKAYEAVINPHFFPKSFMRIVPVNAFLFSDFPLIKTEDQFYQMMKKQGTLNVLGRAQLNFDLNLMGLKGIIFNHGRPLLGRPKWSMTYLERINAVFETESITLYSSKDQVEANLTALVKKIARTVRDEILADLVTRLKNLAKLVPAEFISNVCWVVIDSDLLDRPIAFEDNVGPQMVSEAFAVMKPVKEGSSEYFIEEHLAVQAAMSFFLTQKPEEVEKALLNFQARQTNDASSFAKSAEWFLAWKLNQLLVSAKDRLAGSTRSLRLKKFRALLERATPLNGQLPLSLSKTTLIRGERIGHMYNGTIELPGWMRSIRELATTTGTDRRINATFYFPDNNAGPDLVFALHHHSGVPILCLLQLKCGEADLDKGIKTLDLMQAYCSRESKTLSVLKGYEAKHQAVINEVAQWSASRFPILRVLFTAAVGTRGTKVVYPTTACPEYFTRCDKELTKLVFGAQFEGLLEVVRTKLNTQIRLLDLYKYANEPEP